MENKVLIAVPTGSGTIPASVVQNLLQLHKPCPCGFAVVERQRIDKARNYFAHQCLIGGFTHLLFIDDDQVFSPDILERMLEDDKDIVVAPILARNPDPDGTYKLCAYYSEEKLIKTKSLRTYNPIKEFKDGGHLHLVDGAGTGVMLVKREVFEALKVKYEYIFEFGDITVEGQRRTMSEDMEFSERAVDAGFEIWVDERLRVGHLSNQRVLFYKDE